MSLLALPNELILLIADYLPLQDLNRLHRTSQHLSWLTTRHLHAFAAQDRHSGYGMVLPALHWAAWNGHIPLARLLLDTGAFAIDGKTREHGKTALQCAAWQGHADMARFLLDRGAAVDARDDRYGKTALHQAVVRGWAPIVRLLLERGADVASRDHAGQTALLWATKCQSPLESLLGVFRMMLERAGSAGVVDAQEHDRGETALHWAVWKGQRLTVRLFLEFGADADVASKDGETALEWAVRKGDDEITRLLVGSCEAAEMMMAEEPAVAPVVPAESEEGSLHEKGTRWGKRIRSIGKVVGRMSLLKHLDKRQIKELGEA